MIIRILLIIFLFIIPAIAEEPISNKPWQEVMISVYDLDESARFYKEIAGYQEIWRGLESRNYLAHLGLDNDARAESLLLKSGDQDYGYVRLIKFSGVEGQVPTRPGARVWDTGCYASVMMRAKGMSSIYDDVIKMNWWTETPITSLKFGTSDLRIVIFKGPQGQQVEAYERLNPPLPDAFPDFERLSVPFNIMQSVKDRDVTHAFFRDIIGYDTFFSGPPVTATEEAQMPLGIPLNQTTSSRYRAAIMYPKPSEVGRIEIVEFMDLKGENYADQCMAPNFGILSVSIPVENVDKARSELLERGYHGDITIHNATLAPYGQIKTFTIKTPDGANIDFYEVQ